MESDEVETRLRRALRPGPRLFMNLFARTELVSAAGRRLNLYVLRSNERRRPLVEELCSHMSDYVVDYCIPRSKIQEAMRDPTSSRKVVALATSARRLFADVARSGEAGELLLFLFAEAVVGAPMILSKMSLKTNSSVHFHGADGVYLGVRALEGGFAIYFGESKIFRDGQQALRRCIESIAPMLLDEAAVGTRRDEVFLFKTHLDLGEDALTRAVREFLDPESERFQTLESRGLLLVGQNLAEYPAIVGDSGSADHLRDTDWVRAMLNEFDVLAMKNGLEEFVLELFLVPFPDVDAFRACFLEQLGVGES